MNDSLSRIQRAVSEDRFFALALSLGVGSTLIALALYGYLGIFSRYESDDYCLSAFFLQRNFIGAMVERYLVSSSRYTNILFIGLADKLFGWYNVAVLPALMLGLFVLGLYLLLKEISEVTRMGWSRWLVFFLSLLGVFFSITQAPDLYETLYWRAGMTSHFAPLVFMPFWGAFLVRQIRRTREHSPSLWTLALCFLVPFLIGGLSEPPTALMITILILAIGAVWRWGEVHYRLSVLMILFWSLAGAVTALLVLALAPANSLRMQTPPPGLVELLSRIVDYPLYFIIDTFRSLPVPTLLSVAVPGLLFYVKYTYTSVGPSEERPWHIGMLMLLIAVLAYLLIAASFAPSAYGQSYPAPRARFIGRVLMTAVLMTQGALLGALAARSGRKFFQSSILRGLAGFALIILALYPFRTAWRIFADIPAYRQRAEVWDLRDAEIRALKAQGVQDLVVRFLPEVEIQDLGDRTRFRLNRCAAALYGVNTIVAVPMEGE
jgi:hypothetical protein